MTSCLARLHGDLRYYTTAMYADDVSQVLTDLHYGKVNLMGISYGTAVEQVFQLRHPGQVRTMTSSGSTANLMMPYAITCAEPEPALTGRLRNTAR